MLGDGSGDPGMRQLKQQGAAGAKDTAAWRSTRQVSEAGPDPLDRSGRRLANGVETAFKIVFGQQRYTLRICNGMTGHRTQVRAIFALLSLLANADRFLASPCGMTGSTRLASLMDRSTAKASKPM